MLGSSHVVQHRAFAIRVGAAALVLVLFVVWCVVLVVNVVRLQAEVRDRVRWIQTVRAFEQSLRQADPERRSAAAGPLRIELSGIRDAVRDDATLHRALARTSADLASADSRFERLKSDEGLPRIIPALRRQTARRSQQLSTYWRGLYILAGVSILFASATLGLYVRSYILGVRRAEADAARLHARLLQADRLAALGTLAATIAHEINNPLAFVLSSLDLLDDRIRDSPPADPDVEASVEQAREGVRRVARIVRDLQNMSHPDRSTDLGPVDIHDALESALRICDRDARTRARIVRSFGADIPMVRANEGQLGQVFLNLLVNAIQAIEPGTPNKNTITIRTSVVQEEVRAEILDTGPGIDPKYVDRLFEPFVTTKEVGKGSGLGLYVCRSIVESLRGRIALSRPAEGGTRAMVALPIAQQTEHVSVSSVPVHAPTPTEDRRLRILIVDDEQLLTSALGQSLRAHEVHTVNDGAHALKLARERRFDLILCDLIMPGLTGKQVFEALERDDATIRGRFVFMTGATVTSEARAFAAQIDVPVLEKPFSRSELLDVLDRFL